MTDDAGAVSKELDSGRVGRLVVPETQLTVRHRPHVYLNEKAELEGLGDVGRRVLKVRIQTFSDKFDLMESGL